MALTDPVVFSVIKIDGDYAWLRRVDTPAAEPIMVAQALLPSEIFEGCKVQRVLFDYSMV